MSAKTDRSKQTTDLKQRRPHSHRHFWDYGGNVQKPKARRYWGWRCLFRENRENEPTKASGNADVYWVFVTALLAKKTTNEITQRPVNAVSAVFASLVIPPSLEG
jgi:hypothetical protein